MEYNTSELPYVYMMTALVSVIAGYFYSKLEESVDIPKLLKLSMIFVFIVIFTFLILINISDSKLSFMGLMIFKDLVWMFIGMEFGILVGIIFNIRQGKRLFGLLMSGEIIAGIIGGLCIGIILNYIDTKSLLYISSFTLIISFILLLKILNTFSNRFEDDDEEEETQTDNSYKSLFKNRYYVLFFLISILSFFVFYFIDYIFYFSVEKEFTDEKALASFFGIFFAVLNIVNLCSSLFLSGTMLSRFGIGFGLLAIPILALVGTSSLIFASLISLGFAFFILVVLKLLDEVLDISILNPTFKILYQSIPVKQRLKVLAFRETIIEPMAMGVAGLLLLVLSMFDNINIIYYLLIAMAIVWVFFAKYLKEEYILSLEKILNQRESFSDDLLSKDVNINIFIDGIKSDNEIKVIYSLDSLSKLKYKEINKILAKLLEHESKRVRLYALEFISKNSIYELAQNLKNRIEIEKDSQTLALILKTFCKLSTIDAIDLVAKYVQNKDKTIQEGSILGLLQYCGIDGILIAGKVLNELFESNEKINNKLALKILSSMDTPSFYNQLKESLNHKDTDIKLLAIKAIGNLKIKKLLPDLLLLLEDDSFRNKTVLSLIKFKDSILDEILEYFIKTNSQKTKEAIIKVLANMKSTKANAFLFENIENKIFTDTILQRLYEAGFSTKDEKIILSLLKTNTKQAIFYTKALEFFEKFDKNIFSNSYLVINELRKQKLLNQFFILGYFYSKDTCLQAKLKFDTDSKDKKAYAIEVLDNLLNQNHKKLALTILEDVSFEKKLLIYESIDIKVKDYDDFIKYFLENKTPLILLLSLIYELAQSKNQKYKQNIVKLQNSKNKDLEETIKHTLSILNKG